MTVPFAKIPATLRVPLFYAEIDPSQANTAQVNQRALIIGQITSAGTAVANVPVISQGVAAAKVQGGVGSMLALMTAAYRANDPLGELWHLPLADDGAGVAATGTIAYTGPSTAAGVVSLYVAGQLASAVIPSGTTATNIGVAVRDAVNALTDMPVTASATTGTVTLTAKNKGVCGNDIDIRHNYLGLAAGEALPAGVGAVITAMASGATNPTLTTALDNLVDEEFDFIISPYTDATSIAALTAFLNDTTGRWSYATQVYGHVLMAYRAAYADQITWGGGKNDQHLASIGIYDSPTPNWIWAPAVYGAAAVSLRNDPGQPLNTLAVLGVLAPPLASRFTLAQRNALLYKGVSTFTVARDGTVHIEKLITTYQTNASGQPDNSYLQVTTMFQLMYALRRLRGVVLGKYSRKKLAANGTRFAPGANIVTPNMIRADLIAEYRSMEYDGHVQQAEVFARDLVVEQNTANPNRLDVLWPGILTPGLDIFALLAQFRLS